MNPRLSLIILPLVLGAATAAQAQASSCSSDGVAQPSALLERFVNADCANCWGSAQAPEAAAGALAVDWVVPGSRGDDAPLSAVARRDAQERLDALSRKAPATADIHFTARKPSAFRLRIAQGLPINDYIGVSIEMKPATEGPWTAWLLLVENLPKGTEGSAVERNLVRNSFIAQWDAPEKGAKPAKRYEIRSMQIPEGARPSRLRMVGWLEDSQGRIRAIAQSRCAKK